MPGLPSYTGRDQVEAALAALPTTADPAFLSAIRTVIDRTRDPERVFLRICQDTSRPYGMRFAALYAALLRLRREERLREYTRTVERYEHEFGAEPYFHTFRAVALRLEGSPGSLLQAIEHARRAAHLLTDVAGVQHQVAELITEYLEQQEGNLRSADLAEAEQLVDRAITLTYGRIAHYFETKARILCLRGDFATARSLVRRAIELESHDGHDYMRRISQYQTTRVKIDVFAQRAEWMASQEDFRRDMAQFRTQQLEMLGLLAGIVAFVASTANIAGQESGEDGVRLITAMAGAIILVFVSFFFMAGGRSWRHGACAAALGAALLLAGLLAPGWLVHRT